tara:strand:- start:1350 stop:1922 length:573 start_codon:yes stop_codon:yes gene_type:complete
MKLLYCIRHGYSLHNKLFKQIGEDAYRLPECIDSYLLDEGVDGAMKLNTRENCKLETAELVLVSPLTRALQTAEIVFTGIDKQINVMEILKEWPNGLDTPNQRKRKSELENRFKRFNFDAVCSEEDVTWNGDREETTEELNMRINKFKNYVKQRKEEKIFVIGHTSFLSNMIWGEEREMKHCEIYECVID